MDSVRAEANMMATLELANIEGRTTQIDADFSVVRGLPPRGRTQHVFGRWHRIQFVPPFSERADARFSWVSVEHEKRGFHRHKSRDLCCLRMENLSTARIAELPVPKRFRASQSGTKGLQNMPLCATFLGSFLTPTPRLTRDVIRQHSVGTTRLTSPRMREEDDKQNLAQSRIPLSSPPPGRVKTSTAASFPRLGPGSRH